MVWHRHPPDHRDWEWASQAQHGVLSITHAQPLQPWIELCVEAVAHFKSLARCITHKCPGHPSKGPLYMALHALVAMPSEPDPR